MYETLKGFETGNITTRIDSVKMQIDANKQIGMNKQIGVNNFSIRALADVPENGYPNITYSTARAVPTDQSIINGSVVGYICTITDYYSITLTAGYTPRSNGIGFYGPQITSNQATTPVMGITGPITGTAKALMNAGTGGGRRKFWWGCERNLFVGWGYSFILGGTF